MSGGPAPRSGRARRLVLAALVASGILAGVGGAIGGPAPTSTSATSTPAIDPAQPAMAVPPADPATRNGGEIYRSFREGLADPGCEADVSTRWSRHFAAAPRRLARRDDTLALFGYVVDAVRKASLPTEYALIPFVESGYKPAARSPSGPAGMWQLIKVTARAHKVPIRNGFDGRLSPVESTRAAVRYLKTLHGMFAGDWRLAVMAYNAGEYRILDALERGGQVARDAQPDKLPGLSGITHAYVRKLQALSCLMQQADSRQDWHAALDRPVPRLQAVSLPAGAGRIETWAQRTGRDAERLRRLNPAFADGRVPAAGERPWRILATPPPAGTDTVGTGTDTVAPGISSGSVAAAASATAGAMQPRLHTVEPGDSLWALARRYGVSLRELRQRNGIETGSVLRPGVVLTIDAPAAP